MEKVAQVKQIFLVVMVFLDSGGALYKVSGLG